MKAVILAGGKGTRLSEHTKDIPKPMLRIGKKPLLEYQIELLKSYELKDIVILINYLGNVIVDYFGNGEKFGVNITYFEEKEPLGTVGGIKEIEELIKDDFLVFYGDIMINMDLKRLFDFHNSKKSECTLVIHPNNHPYDSDLVETNADSRVINIFSKGSKRNFYYKNLVNAGAYIFSPVIFQYLEKGRKADFGRDIFPVIYNKIRMYGYNTPEYLKDMGTPDRLADVEKDLLSGKIKRMNLNHKRKAIFLDRDGVINHEISFIHKPEQFQLYDYTAKALKKINDSEYLSIVITNQSVIARNMCTLEELNVIHKKMETELGNQRSKIDALYFCPHHPDKGFPEERTEYKIDCECRKPKPGMLLQAAKDFNIDLSASYMIGDSSRDILAGYNAGCITIGVRTGYGIRKTERKPDYMFQDMKDAVDFIIDEPYVQVLKQVSEFIEENNKKPVVLLIGGNSRSGKSTLAKYLKKNLDANENILHIELDNWLLPEEQRSRAKDVYERFQLKKIENDIFSILKGEKVKINENKVLSDQPDNEIIYSLGNKKLIIIEGVTALSLNGLHNMADLKIFVTTDEEKRKQRIIDYYKWRGRDESYITELIKQRSKDEYQLIEKDSKFADIVVES